jgi:hypothetical protein
MAREIDVAALFFNVENLHDVGPRSRQTSDGPKLRGMHQARELLRAEKHTHMDGDFWNGGEGVKVDLLPTWAVRIKMAGDTGCVVSDGDNLIGGIEDSLGKTN